MDFQVKISDKTFLSALNIEIEYNQKWISLQECQNRGLKLEIRELSSSKTTKSIRMVLENVDGETFRLGGIRLAQKGDNSDFLSVNNPNDIALYLEGWSMPSACGLKKYGDYDFSSNEHYMPFVISEPKEYIADKPNHFRSDYALGIQNKKSTETLLIGFVTTADQYGRYQIFLDEYGASFLAITASFDDRIVEKGDLVATEEILFMVGDNMNSMLCQYADIWGKKMNARVNATLPIGWCSWYYYFANVTEKDMLENVDFLANNRKEYPLEYIQLDDGFQPACGDWLDPFDDFPNGVDFWAKEAIKQGFKPALWLAPFLVEKSSKLFAEHPDWCIHDENGKVVFPMNWRGTSPTAILDGTNPAVQQHFRTMFAKIRALGFEYVKLDFMVFASAVRNGILFDKKATRAQAFRRGLNAIREGFGADGFILGCTAPFGPCVGLVDGERIATDITPYWAGTPPLYDEAPTVPNVCRNGIHHSYMHRRLFLNDPDTHIARTDNNKLTEEEVRLWTASLKINGGMLLLSDRFQTLIPERAAFSKMLLDEPDCYVSEPLDRMERTIPAVWYAKHKTKNQAILGLFNFEDTPQKISVDMAINSEMRELFSGDIVSKLPEELAPHTSFVVEFTI